MSSRPFSLAVALLVAGCGSAAPVPQGPDAAALGSSPRAPAAPSAPTASPAPATQASGQGTSPAPPRVPHQYQRVVSGYGAFSLYAGVPRWFDDGKAIDLRSGKVEFDVGFSNFVVAEGDGLWFGKSFSPMSACPEPSAFAKFENGAWRPRVEGNVHDLFVGPWVRGSSIAAIVPLRLGPPWGYELVVLEKNRTPPRAARRTREQRPECHTRLDTIESLLAFPTGEIHVLGRECERLPKEVEPSAPAGECECMGLDCPPECPARPEEPEPVAPLLIEVFGKGRHEFLSYPFAEAGVLRGHAPTSMWTTGTDQDGKWAFAHFDGATWSVMPERYTEILSFRLPPGELGPAATRLFLHEGHLIELRGNELREHELPPDCSPANFELDGAQLWVECESDGDLTVFTTRTDILPLGAPAESEPERELTDFFSKKLPRLDPSAPSQHSCGSSREFEPYPSSKVSPAGKPTAPRPPVPGSKVRNVPDEFGY